MRDPDLVQRAERAAGALERAWDRWRNMHGYGSEPLAPVSSYVGYSMDEPWGQPRVVFGVAANEAEQIAALLDGHDCYGPVHAEVTGRPEWRRMSAGDGGSARSVDDQLSIPHQAHPSALDMLSPLTRDVDAEELDRNLGEPTETDDRLAPKDQAKSSGQSATGALPAGTPQELAPLPPMPDPSPAGPMGSASLAPRKTRSRSAKPSAPGYRAARFSGSPVSYKATQEPTTRTPVETGATAEAADTGIAPDGMSADASDAVVARDATAASRADAASEVSAASETSAVSEASAVSEVSAARDTVTGADAVVAESVVTADAVVAPDSIVAPDTSVDADDVVVETATPDEVVAPDALVALDENIARGAGDAVAADATVAEGSATEHTATDASATDGSATDGAASAAEAKTSRAGSAAAAKPARPRPRPPSKASRTRR